MPKDGKRRAVLEDAGMYRMNRQMRIEDFAFPYGQLDKNNEWTVRHVSENPYLQYCLGLKEYTSKCPFGASTTVELRKRFPFLLCWQLPPPGKIRTITTIRAAAAVRTRAPSSWMPSAVRLTFPTRRISSF